MSVIGEKHPFDVFDDGPEVCRRGKQTGEDRKSLLRHNLKRYGTNGTGFAKGSKCPVWPNGVIGDLAVRDNQLQCREEIPCKAVALAPSNISRTHARVETRVKLRGCPSWRAGAVKFCNQVLSVLAHGGNDTSWIMRK